MAATSSDDENATTSTCTKRTGQGEEKLSLEMKKKQVLWLAY
jgi:hypothetical protein